MTRQEIVESMVPTTLTHHSTIVSILILIIIKNNITDADVPDFITFLLKHTNKTIGEMDTDIEIGCKNGYTVEQQIAIITDL
jgi:hypothetical protein